MSPTKKKTKKTPTKKASAAKRGAAKKASKKPVAKKKAKKTASKKAAAKAPSSKAKRPATKAKVPAAKAKVTVAKAKVTVAKAKVPVAKAKVAAPKKKSPAPAKKAAGKTTKEATARQKAPKGKLVPLSAIPHPKYGLKFECFSCATRFYVMGRPEPVCPKCGTDQRERPKEEKKSGPRPKRPAVRPMAPLLDDDEEVATTEDLDRGTRRSPAEPDAMFDDAEAASVSEDTEEAPTPKTPAPEDD